MTDDFGILVGLVVLLVVVLGDVAVDCIRAWRKP